RNNPHHRIQGRSAFAERLYRIKRVYRNCETAMIVAIAVLFYYHGQGRKSTGTGRKKRNDQV
ncbi:MAG: hypothetical protein IJQ88_02335, partial [Clostridia bacterium]|nr:hypothetical protein [Clostridia bacterium]